MLAALVLAASVSAAATPPAPTSWVEDHAGLLSEPTRAALDARLRDYEARTGHQVVLWIGSTIGDEPLADWAVRTFAAWKLGRKGVDDGVAMFVLAKDRNIDIEVGYGLEDRLTDAMSSRIIHDVMAPRLRAGQPDAAMTAGVDAVLATLGGDGAIPPQKPVSTPDLVLGGVGLLLGVFLLIRYPRLALAALWFAMRGGGGGFGGDGGGFSGGGGRSGGGGARGGW